MSQYCWYFAYGSNLHPGRLLERVPSAQVAGASVLSGHEVRFGKRGLDGSGKCTVRAVASPAALVHGILYAMRRSERAALDAVEGPDYQRLQTTFRLGFETVEGFYYEARDYAFHNDLEPFDWYRELVVCGARFHNFPATYIENLAAVRSRPDPDPERAAAMLALLARLSIT